MLSAATPREYHWLDHRRYSFSPAVRFGANVVFSGQTAASFDSDLNAIVVPEGLLDQLDVIYDKICMLLAAEGLVASDVTEIVEYIVGGSPESIRNVKRVRERRLPATNASVHTSSVDALLRPGAVVEVAIKARQRQPAEAHQPPICAYRLAPARSRGLELSFQVAEVVDAAERLLDSLDLDWSHVAFAHEHVARPTNGDAVTTILDRTDRIGLATIAGARVWTDRLIQPGGLVQLDLRLAAGPVESIVSKQTFDGPETLVAARCTAERIFLSGQYGHPESSNIEEEAFSAYTRLLDVLFDAGVSARGLVETIEYLTPDVLDDRSRTAAVRKTLLPEPFCAATGIVCNSARSQPVIATLGLLDA